MIVRFEFSKESNAILNSTKSKQKRIFGSNFLLLSIVIYNIFFDKCTLSCPGNFNSVCFILVFDTR